MDRWPNWIRRSATNREIPDSSSGRSTKKGICMFDWFFKISLQKSVIYFFIIAFIILFAIVGVMVGPDYDGMNAPALNRSKETTQS